ncbi:unnamed protein product [Rotaria sordida]|uniref:Dynein heavy chain tail domain-containing protein n=1 Tax=Rotaria sordida TaxID=392033 RepID=A0A815S8Y8_9BILA|nr:unnamed protein product [Rotaria sordida]CAF1650196.1 unnamed protein product [Rotaria sordida]
MDDPSVDVNPTVPSGTSNTPPTANVSLADLDTFVNYLKRVCAPILDSSLENTNDIERLFTDRSSIDCIKKFISDVQCQTILISKTITVKEDPTLTETDPTTNSSGDTLTINSSSSSSSTSSSSLIPDGLYTLSTEVHYINPKMLSLVIVKRGQLIESDKKFHTQLRIINLVDSSPYETLHAYISHVIGPYFKSYVRESGKSERDGDKMAPTMEKKITELEMGLLHLQQNIEIPEVNLAIHPIVSQVAQKCLNESRRPKVDDFSEYLDNTEFLNSLQSHVNRWVREIQRVTKLHEDSMKGSTRQEISFWLNLERALTRIQEKRESVEVQLTFDILKTVKRFHATVGFDNDTGLKSAMDTVKDHSVLMKDFPINDLLSANELDKIRTALTTIFQHLKKLRSTRYPVSRAGRLMEAVSQDLMQQMLKVLNTYRLMHIGYTDFERIVKACDDVFATWDDEYERLSTQVRDVRRTARTSDVRMAWRVSLSHKKLQQRLDHMKRFRKQHEQLRSVIDRVLLQPVPTPLQPQTSINDEQDKDNIQTSTNGPSNETRTTVTAANVLNDVNAIDEVNMAYESVKEIDALDVSKEGQDAWEMAMKR